MFDHVLGGFSVRLTEDEAIRLSRHPAVLWVEENGWLSGADTQFNPPSWGLDRIDDRWLPLDGSNFHLLSGAGVRVYVLDSGIRTSHVDFGGRAVPAYGAVNDGWGANDCNGHGTHVAGIIAGTEHGVAKGARVHSVRVLNCQNGGTWDDFIEGVQWITANHVHPALVNASISGPGHSSADKAVQDSIDHGLLYVIASGNDRIDACTVTPARVGAALTVAGTGESDSVYYWSNQGSCVDLFAPGENIVSLGHANDQATTVKTGTSMAAPHVAGVAAMYLSAYPSATPSQVANAVIGASTTGVIPSSDLFPASPNRLLFSDFITCPTGTSACSETCVNLQNNSSHCGGCGIVCNGTCTQGSCVPEPVCPSGTWNCCSDGVCRSSAMCTRIGC